MKICYNPYNKSAIKNNKYIQQVADALGLINVEVYSLKECITRKVFKEVEIFNLNWFESINGNNRVELYINYLIRVTIIYILKFTNKKILWTLHNKVPHNSSNSKLEKKLMLILAKKSDRIIIHSYGSNKVLVDLVGNKDIVKKLVYIPHPNYIGVYDELEESKSDISKNDKLNILFIGQVRPYKNIEILIEALKEIKYEKINLIIAGKANSDDYKKSIECLVSNDNRISTILRFIEEDEMMRLIKWSNILVFPYDINSTLNSGSILLAFSNKRTVISPYIGTLEEFNEDLYFSYKYNNDNEHKRELIKKIEESYSLFNSGNKLNEMGEELYNEVKNKNNIKVISELYNNLFKELKEK